MNHRTRIEPVPVPGWTLHHPCCECGWSGDLLRYRHLADDQAAEHRDEHPTTQNEQPALFGDDLEV